MTLSQRRTRGFGRRLVHEVDGMKTVSMTQLHRNFSPSVAQAAAGETILVTRNGKNLCRLRLLDEADLQEGSGAPEIDAAATAKG